jgi:GDP-4-dehydro-6-deoxy-D-mannose reductase
MTVRSTISDRDNAILLLFASFARQIVRNVEIRRKWERITAGDVSIVRDFLDVRDVVKAYYLLFMKGQKGAVYNVCSGQGVSLSEIIQRLAAVAGVNVHIVKNDKLIRPMDNRIIIGSYEKIKQTTGWEPKIPLSQSLQDIVAYWNQQI